MQEQDRIHPDPIAEIKLMRTRQEQWLGALSAGCDLICEDSVHAEIKGILEQSFGVQVIDVNEFDDEGTVFGVPDQVEIDIMIKNGEVILCELKSSMSKPDMYVFARKVEYRSTI